MDDISSKLSHITVEDADNDNECETSDQKDKHACLASKNCPQVNAAPCGSNFSEKNFADQTHGSNHERSTADVSGKRLDYLSWSDYFMAIAFLSAQRSKDPVTQVGACIVNADNRVVAVGYNGMPTGVSDDEIPWTKNADRRIDTKYMYVCHAELNAVLNRNSASLDGCTIYVALFPCNECAKVIIQSRIRKVVYLADRPTKDEFIASRRMLTMAGVQLECYRPSRRSILIDFTSCR